MSITVICQKTGLSFETESKRTKNHPKIMMRLSDANKGGWYQSALEAIEEGREAGLDTLEQFLDVLAACEEAARDQKAINKREYIARLKERRQREYQKWLDETAEPTPVATPAELVAVEGLFEAEATIGELATVIDNGEKKVLVCVESRYVPEDAEANFYGGWHNAYREATDAEKASAEYRSLVGRIEAEKAEVAKEQAERKARTERDEAEIAKTTFASKEEELLAHIYAGQSEVSKYW